MEVNLELPSKIIENFRHPARHRVFDGGRGSGKTRSLALMTAVYGYQFAEAHREGVILASREHLNSLDESSLEEIKAAIRSVPWLNDYYDIGEKYVRTKNRRVSYAFTGLGYNLDSLKSKARILLNWTDEAEGVSEAGWRKLIPTIREEGSENWVSYNPESPESATHRRFIEKPPSNCVRTTINWRDNPWFPEVLNNERLDDKRLRSDTYEHVWEGAFLTLTEAQVFSGKFEVKEFDPRPHWDGPYYGIDFGFRPDPLAAVEVYVADNQLWIRREAYKTEVEMDGTAPFIKKRLPGIEKYVARADSAEPKTISYMLRNGLPRTEPVKKWPNSVMEGVRYMRGYERINIHPDCDGTAREFRLYSHKTDRLTGDILPDIIDANNHAIDAIRYAIAPLIKAHGQSKTSTVKGLY